MNAHLSISESKNIRQMSLKETLKSIREKIAIGETESAFAELGACLESGNVAIDLKNHFYGLSNQFQIDKRNRIVVGLDNYGIQNSITQRLLNLIDEVEKSADKGKGGSKKAASPLSILNDDYSQSLIVAKEIERQKLIIQSKIIFLEKLSHEVWTFLLKVLNVAYDKAYREHAQFEKTYREYDFSSWGHLSTVKGIIGGSVWFTEDETQNLLNQFYNWLLQIDVELETMVKSVPNETGGSDARTAIDRYSKIFDEIYSEPDKLFNALKTDFKF